VEEIVRRYLRVFVTRDMAELEKLVDEDIEIQGAGNHVRGRHFVAGAIEAPGLTCTDLEVIDLFEHGDRVSVYFRQHLRHDTTGEQVSMTGLKLYRLRDGKIVQMWGETDLYGLLRQLGKVPAEIVF
jgi:ketosteroid isomerase-like protein